MLGVYKRINTLLTYLIPPYSTESFDVWAALAHPGNRVLDLAHKYEQTFEVDVDRKVFIHKGSESLFNKEDITTMEYPLYEKKAQEVYEALHKLALKKIDAEYTEQENKERERLKSSYLNTKLFGQSMDFIVGD